MTKDKLSETREKVRILGDQGYSNKEIQSIIFSETGRLYAIDTIRQYRKYRMDLKKDNEYMQHCREEYQSSPSDEQSLLEEMFSLAKAKGYLG